jgi:hypothetical protein
VHINNLPVKYFVGSARNFLNAQNSSVAPVGTDNTGFEHDGKPGEGFAKQFLKLY